MTSNTPKQWEVWHARFAFAEKKGYKYRPVIVVSTSSETHVVMMVTSATNRLTLENDYALQEWQAAGLDKPSIARADRIIEISSDYLGSAGKIGRLADTDIRAIKNILQRKIKHETS